MFLLLEMILRSKSSRSESTWLPALHLITLLMEAVYGQPEHYAFASWPTFLPVLGALVTSSKMLRVPRAASLGTYAVAVKLMLVLARLVFKITARFMVMRVTAVVGLLLTDKCEGESPLLQLLSPGERMYCSSPAASAAAAVYLQQRQKQQQQAGVDDDQSRGFPAMQRVEGHLQSQQQQQQQQACEEDQSLPVQLNKEEMEKIEAIALSGLLLLNGALQPLLQALATIFIEALPAALFSRQGAANEGYEKLNEAILQAVAAQGITKCRGCGNAGCGVDRHGIRPACGYCKNIVATAVQGVAQVLAAEETAWKEFLSAGAGSAATSGAGIGGANAGTGAAAGTTGATTAPVPGAGIGGANAGTGAAAGTTGATTAPVPGAGIGGAAAGSGAAPGTTGATTAPVPGAGIGGEPGATAAAGRVVGADQDIRDGSAAAGGAAAASTAGTATETGTGTAAKVIVMEPASGGAGAVGANSDVRDRPPPPPPVEAAAAGEELVWGDSVPILAKHVVDAAVETAVSELVLAVNDKKNPGIQYLYDLYRSHMGVLEVCESDVLPLDLFSPWVLAMQEPAIREWFKVLDGITAGVLGWGKSCTMNSLLKEVSKIAHGLLKSTLRTRMPCCAHEGPCGEEQGHCTYLTEWSDSEDGQVGGEEVYPTFQLLQDVAMCQAHAFMGSPGFCCSNPECDSLEGCSEMMLVLGRTGASAGGGGRGGGEGEGVEGGEKGGAGVCGACREVWYCSRVCQQESWQAHMWFCRGRESSHNS